VPGEPGRDRLSALPFPGRAGRSERSPTGTGLSARLAALAARGLLKIGDRYDHTSLIGSRFEGRIVAAAEVGGLPAIVSAIRGRAWITGFHSYVVDPSDPYPTGYRVADTWGVTDGLTQGGGDVA